MWHILRFRINVNQQNFQHICMVLRGKQAVNIANKFSSYYSAYA